MKHVRMALMSAVLLVVSALPASAQWQYTEESPPAIEVVFCIDTTGSMGGLIQAAKEKTWAIANMLATSTPTPDIRIGLVAFRDRGDVYITRVTDLSDDLDAVYQELMSFRAEGGGDMPESVNQALHEAVTKINWSTDAWTYRVIFLIGDAPPHMNYPDDVKYPETCKLAVEKGIIINTIQCGNIAQTTPYWKDIARLAEGQYFRVEQAGSAILESTPFDLRLAELGAQLDGTRIYYGTAEQRADGDGRIARSGELYEATTPSSQAQRAAFNASAGGRLNFRGHNELVHAVVNGTVELEELKDEELPDAFREMTPDERRAHVENAAKTRADIQAQIRELSAQRNQYIRERIDEKKIDVERSFEHQVNAVLDRQAATKNITIGEVTY